MTANAFLEIFAKELFCSPPISSPSGFSRGDFRGFRRDEEDEDASAFRGEIGGVETGLLVGLGFALTALGDDFGMFAKLMGWTTAVSTSWTIMVGHAFGLGGFGESTESVGFFVGRLGVSALGGEDVGLVTISTESFFGIRFVGVDGNGFLGEIGELPEADSSRTAVSFSGTLTEPRRVRIGGIVIFLGVVIPLSPESDLAGLSFVSPDRLIPDGFLGGATAGLPGWLFSRY